jgi:hypothetical protein
VRSLTIHIVDDGEHYHVSVTTVDGEKVETEDFHERPSELLHDMAAVFETVGA